MEESIQFQFAKQVVKRLMDDESIIAVAAGGSWLSSEIDEFSDLDLVIVTKEKITADVNIMKAYAAKLGKLLNSFTGDHVGEPRLLICLYDDPLLHVDLKFITLEEIHARVEDPFILLDRDNKLKNALTQSTANFPHPDYQWIEDRFWTWIHYALLKIGRGEYMEATDFFGFLRSVVLGPLLHLKNGNLPRGVRRIETSVDSADFIELAQTIPAYDKIAILQSLRASVTLYKRLRQNLFDDKVILRTDAERAVMEYLANLEIR